MKYLLTVMVILNSLLITSIAEASIDARTYIPPQAFQYFGTIEREQWIVMPDFAYPFYFAGLIEHESCITLTHRRCWSPTSQLKTQREQGLGMMQLTRTWNADGTVRFDVLADLRQAHMAELKELSWSSLATRPDLQIRAGIVMTRNNYRALHSMADPYERLAATDSAYNGGLGGVRKQRTICGLKANCDPQKWFGHLEHIVVKSTKALYAGRSADTINKHHVTDVLKVRMVKYQPYFD